MALFFSKSASLFGSKASFSSSLLVQSRAINRNVANKSFLFGKYSFSTQTKTTTHTETKTSHGTAVAHAKGHGEVSHAHGKEQHVAHGHESNPELDVPPKQHNVEHLFKFQEGDYIPPTETHAVGEEKAEIDFGPLEPTTLSQHFGTRENPVEVPSYHDFRMVGCTGSETVDHELLWHEVKVGKDLMCMECGQVFRLKHLPGLDAHGHGHGDEHDEHGHGHEEEFHGHVDGSGFRFMPPPKTKSQREAEKKEREEELKKDPKAPLKQVKATGVDYHTVEEHTDQGRAAAKAPIFHDQRTQEYKDRQ